jgi:hypothetical protein
MDVEVSDNCTWYQSISMISFSVAEGVWYPPVSFFTHCRVVINGCHIFITWYLYYICPLYIVLP